jgi:hypothetical protein
MAAVSVEELAIKPREIEHYVQSYEVSSAYVSVMCVRTELAHKGLS